MIKRLLFSFSSLLISHAGISQVLQSDSLALVDFYNSTNGDGWYAKDNWLNGPVDTWYGITVTGNRVTKIELRENGLTGTLPGCAGAIDHAMPKRIDHQRLILNSRRTYYISMDHHGQIDPAEIGLKNQRLWSK